MFDKTFTMPKDLFSKWIAALRSGDFLQAKGALKNGEGYCCLGLLQYIADGDVERDSVGSLPLPTTDWALSHGCKAFNDTGFNPVVCYDTSIRRRQRLEISTINDRGVSFEIIANLLENHYKEPDSD